MDKSKVNFFIDALMFLVMTSLAGLGLLIKYILIPGREAWAKYGRKMELTWLGLDRHAWGKVHLYLAFLLLGLLVVHIILHWRMILGLLARCISRPASRLGMASIYLLVAMALLALPLIVTPEVNEMGIRSDLGLEAPSSGIEGLPLSAANLRKPLKENATSILPVKQSPSWN